MATRKPRIRLVLDFDGTITMADTTAVIGSHVLAKARELAEPGTAEDKLPRPMEYYSEQYMREYREWKDSHPHSEAGRKTIEDEVAYLSASKDVERASYLRVRSAAIETSSAAVESSSAMFKLGRDDAARDKFMIEAGRQSIRTGSAQIREPNVLKKLIDLEDDDNNSWGIVSVSWSRGFILGVLVESGLSDESQIERVANQIHCNELLAPLRKVRNPERRLYCTAEDKLRALKGLLTKWDAMNGPKSLSYPVSSTENTAIVTIYVGDSITDLGCLVGPSIGIYLKPDDGDDAVLQTLERLGVSCLSIKELPISDTPRKLLEMLDELESKSKPKYIVCRIRKLEELYEWISGLG